MSDEEAGWSRGEWALWWLDHDEVDEAARALEAGDAVAVTQADFRNLSAALGRRGLVGVFEDGQVFVYTREQARQVAAERDVGGSGSLGNSERRPPGRNTPASPIAAPAKRTA